MYVVICNVGGHEGGEIGAESSNLFMNIDEKGVGGPASQELDGAAGYSIEV